MDTYQEYSHFIGTHDIDGSIITELEEGKKKEGEKK